MTSDVEALRAEVEEIGRRLDAAEEEADRADAAFHAVMDERDSARERVRELEADREKWAPTIREYLEPRSKDHSIALQENETLRNLVRELEAALRETLDESGMQSHRTGCALSMVDSSARFSRAVLHKGCPGCHGEALLAKPKPAGEEAQNG